MIVALVAAAALDLAAYRGRLEQIDALLARGENAQAAAIAASLEDATIRHGDAEIAADRWTLVPIARREPHRARLRALLASLQPESAPARAPDAALLEQLRREQEPAGPAPGGEIDPLDAFGASLREQVVAWTKKAVRAIGRAFLRLVRWLFRLFRPETGALLQGGGAITGVILIGVGFILFVLVTAALLSVRRRAAAPIALAGGARQATIDEDPMSRTAFGWEQRARELAGQGRHREAIRAWYHAILARCAAAGILHLRRGRTNWEYAYALPASVPWRDRFEDLTQRFDLEWYGRPESTGEALEAFADGASGILRSLGPRE